MATATYISTDYFRDYFIRFIAEAGFTLDDFPTEDIDSRCDRAWEAFSEARLAGAPLDMANEEAVNALVDGVGSPQLRVVATILLDNFDYILSEDDKQISAASWAQGLIANIPDLFDGVAQLRAGVDPSVPDSSRYLMIGRIARYLDDNGIR